MAAVLGSGLVPAVSVSITAPIRTVPSATSLMLTAVENGGAGRSKMVALGGVDLP